VVVGTAGDDLVAARDEHGGHRAGVGDHLLLVFGKGGLERLLEGHRLGGDHVHQRPALGAGEHHRGDLLLDVGVGAADDDAAARAAQGLVGGAGDDVGKRHRVGVQAGGDQAGDVRHVDEEQCADLVRDGTETGEVEMAGVGREAGDDHLRLAFDRLRLERVVVDHAVVGHAVLRRVVELAGEVDLGAVGQVAAMGQAHAEDGVTRLQQGQIHRSVGLRAGVRLHVGPVGAEELLDAVDGELLHHVHMLAATVVALSGIALGVLVGEHRALGLHHARAGVVLGGDELDVVFLALALGLDGGPEFGVVAVDLHLHVEHGGLLNWVGCGK